MSPDTTTYIYVLQYLPVFRMWTGGGDSQLVNSVYFDNRQMQLYHGRMDKNPGAIALRLRWYISLRHAGYASSLRPH